MSHLVLLSLSERIGTRSRTIKVAKYLIDLDIADDIALISSDENNIQKILLSVEHWALRVGLKIDASKTEYMLSGLLV
jgi:hypothetical protein